MIEPTKEMIEAGAMALVQWEADSVWPDSWGSMAIQYRKEARKVWMAMNEVNSAAKAEEVGCDARAG
jgi:predicted membrane chloride channel (bestrophin family)